MQDVLAGFATIAVVIAVGFLLAHSRVLDVESQGMLARLAFYVASPALMVTVLGRTDVSQLFSANLVASLGSVVVTATVAVLLARLVWRRTASDTVIATFSASYVNAGNLGLPIAAYVLGDVSLIAPMLLAQLMVLQPLGLAVLDSTVHVADPAQSRGRRLLDRLGQPLRNPLMLGSLAGLLLSVTGLPLPRVVLDPLTLIGGMAVPAMLIAYGISLRLGPRPGAGEPPVQIGTIVALKLVLQPVVAYLIGRFVVGLDGLDLLAVTVVAALPTAQNVFTHAVRYRRAEILARDSIFISTLLSVPVLLLIAGVLG
ncbi:AEC family transporter [Microlunatus capsulatus]|uniref:Permease n=1 Tax=Microlunatus capsulatus TaxID=99117 RepID=A0ABS4ZFT7_9ACTN|nr:AEC family transporter [Microlunatus capsulatus]MBP2419098.1 putative permease [Microlunatus capsulatus]